MMNSQVLRTLDKDQLSLTNPRDALHHGERAGVFNLPHLHLAPPLGVTPFEFFRDFRRQKARALGYRVALFA